VLLDYILRVSSVAGAARSLGTLRLETSPEVTLSKPLLKAVSPRPGCLGPCPAGIAVSPWVEAPQSLQATGSSVHPRSEKAFFFCFRGISCVSVCAHRPAAGTAEKSLAPASFFPSRYLDTGEPSLSAAPALVKMYWQAGHKRDFT